jgi:hypothetical protein
MPIEATPAYIATIQPDHTISLPEEMPVGTRVMVIVVPSKVTLPEEDPARAARFKATFAALQAALTSPISGLPSDEELKALVGKARKTPAS